MDPQIASSSRTIFSFAEGYGKLAQEQHPSRPIPERLPSEREVMDMLGNVEYIRRSLESVRDLVQQHNRAEIPREAKGKASLEEEDTTMYDGPKQVTYGGTTEVKKRRGVSVSPAGFVGLLSPPTLWLTPIPLTSARSTSRTMPQLQPD